MSAASRQRAATHSIDFRTVFWNGQRYYFTATQSMIVGMLWRQWEEDPEHEVGSETLLQGAGAESRCLSMLFANHPAWKVLIVPGCRQGSYRLST
jgi:hypothetical protein